MGFDHRDIRPSMDVYTRDDAYLGTVLAVVPGPVAVTEERVPEGARQSSAVNGELLGPMPTGTIGNPGPTTQSARALYGVGAGRARPIGRGAIVVGKWWGLISRRAIPLDAVLTVSLERVILEPTREELEGRRSVHSAERRTAARSVWDRQQLRSRGETVTLSRTSPEDRRRRHGRPSRRRSGA